MREEKTVRLLQSTAREPWNESNDGRPSMMKNFFIPTYDIDRTKLLFRFRF